MRLVSRDRSAETIMADDSSQQCKQLQEQLDEVELLQEMSNPGEFRWVQDRKTGMVKS